MLGDRLGPQPERVEPGFWAGFVACGLVLAVAIPVLNLCGAAEFGRRTARLPRAAVRQISLLRAPGAEPRSDLGLCRHPEPRPRRLLRARRLLHGHVPDAPDRHARRLRQSAAAGFHGVPQLEGAALVLVGLRPFRLGRGDGGAGARPARPGLRLARLPLARHRRLSVDHHPGDDLCAVARLLPQRHGVRRQ